MAAPLIPPTPAAPDGNAGPELKLPTAGTTTIDEQVRFEADLLVLTSLSGVCDEIVARVGECLQRHGSPATLILVDPNDLAAVEHEAAFTAQVASLTAAFETVQSIAGSIPGEANRRAKASARARSVPISSTALASAAIGLLGALQGDTTFSGRTAKVSARALAFELAKRWERSSVATLHLPEFATLDRNQVTTTTVQMDIDRVVAVRDAASRALHRLADAVRTLTPQAPDYVVRAAALNAARDQFESTDGLTRATSQQLATIDPATGTSPLRLIMRARAMRAWLEQHPGALFLFCEPLVASGSYRTVKNLARSLFWSDGLDVAAGLVVAYCLLTRDGSPLCSGLARSGRGFVPVRHLWRTTAATRREPGVRWWATSLRRAKPA